MIQNDHNWVLIGMPGSGKSTIGKALSKLLSLPYIDTDELSERISKVAFSRNY